MFVIFNIYLLTKHAHSQFVSFILIRYIIYWSRQSSSIYLKMLSANRSSFNAVKKPTHRSEKNETKNVSPFSDTPSLYHERATVQKGPLVLRATEKSRAFSYEYLFFLSLSLCCVVFLTYDAKLKILSAIVRSKKNDLFRSEFPASEWFRYIATPCYFSIPRRMCFFCIRYLFRGRETQRSEESHCNSIEIAWSLRIIANMRYRFPYCIPCVLCTCLGTMYQMASHNPIRSALSFFVRAFSHDRPLKGLKYIYLTLGSGPRTCPPTLECTVHGCPFAAAARCILLVVLCTHI